LVLGFVYLISVRRLEREVARLSSRRRFQPAGRARTGAIADVGSAGFATAANAQAAAQQRDLAKQDQSNSEAQAQLARQQDRRRAAKADQATQQAEEYRQGESGTCTACNRLFGKSPNASHRHGPGDDAGQQVDSLDFDKANIKPEYRDILNRIAGS